MNVRNVCSGVYLPVVPVTVNDQCEAYALLDTDSTSTFLSQLLVTRLKLDENDVSFKMNTLNKSSDVRSKRVSFDLKSIDGCQNLKLDNVLVVSRIPVGYPEHLVDFHKYPHLKDLPIGNVCKDIQVDMDNWYG